MILCVYLQPGSTVCSFLSGAGDVDVKTTKRTTETPVQAEDCVMWIRGRGTFKSREEKDKKKKIKREMKAVK